ncbi:MAG: ribonuclease P protein component [Desulfosoma sp.]|uniref:ribonuclease P protein component n=1 Tax=Desulfosoma sp. TaxID=2603217 RepID=UPI004049A225
MRSGHGAVVPATKRCRPLSFRPEERLRKRSEFLRVKSEGRRLSCGAFVLNVAPNRLLHHRLGLVIQKRYWKAVTRNRIKRRLREWFRHAKHTLPLPNLDIVVIARPGAETVTPARMADLFRECLKKGGLRMA